MKSSRSNKNNPNKRMAASVHEGMASGVSKFRHSYSKSKRIIAFALALAMVLGLIYVDGKRREARADGESTDTAFTAYPWVASSTSEDFSEFFTEDMYETGTFIDDNYNLSSKTANLSAGEISGHIDVSVPSENIILKLPQIANYVSEDGTTAQCDIWVKGSASLTNELFNASVDDLSAYSSFLVTGTNVVSTIKAGETVQLVHVNYTKDEDKWKFDNFNVLSADLITVSAESASTVDASIGDLALETGDTTSHFRVDAASNSSDIAFVKKYTKYYVSKTQITSTSDFSGKLVDESDAMAALNIDSNEGDGTYYVYKVVAIPYNNGSDDKVAYGYFEGKITRDFYTDISESAIKLYKGSAEDDGTCVDPLSNDYSIVIEAGDVADLSFAIDDSSFYGTDIADANRSGNVDEGTSPNIKKTIPIPVSSLDTDDRPVYCGENSSVKITLTQGSKKPVIKTISLKYDDGTPSFVLSTTGVKEKVYFDEANKKYYVKGKTATINANVNGGGSFGKATEVDITSSDATVTKNAIALPNRSLSDYDVATVSVTEDKVVSVSGTVKNNYNKTGSLKYTTGDEVEPGFSIVFDSEAPTATVTEFAGYGSDKFQTVSDVVSFTNANKKLTCKNPVTVKLTLKDNLSGLVKSTVSASIDGTAIASDNVSLVEDSENPGTYAMTVTVPADDAYKGLDKTLKITASDLVGNDRTVDVIIPYSDEKITITSVSGIEFEAGNSYDDGTNVYNNGTFKLVYYIESSMPITVDEAVSAASLKATLKGDTDTEVDFSTKASSKKIECTNNVENDYKYTVTYTFTPENFVTSKYTNILFNISNVNGFKADNDYKVDIITIDLTAPTLTVTEDVTTEKGDGNWYHKLFLNIVYNDDDPTTISSGINNIVITNVDGETSKTIDVTDPADLGYKIVQVNESENETDGKTVSIKAYDNLNNESVEWHNDPAYFVDGTNPVPTLGAKIGETDLKSTDTYFGNPVISVKATDNIRVAGYTLKITEPDGTEVTKTDLTGDITAGISVNLFSIASKKDGAYKVEFECTDQAGNKASAPVISFKLDNTAPRIKFGEVIQTKTPDNKIKMDNTEDEEKEYNAPLRITSTEPYSVAFTVDEANIKTVVIKEDGAAVTTPAPSTDADGNKVYTITGTKGAKGVTIPYEIEVIDAAGTRIYRKLNVTCLQEKMEVSRTISSSDVKVETDGSVMTNVGKFDIVYTIASDTLLTKDNITYTVTGADADVANFVKDDKSEEGRFVCTKNADYNYTSTFTVSVDVPENKEIKLGEMAFSAENPNGIAGNALDPATLNIIVDTLKPATQNVKITQASSFGTDTKDASSSDVTFEKCLSSNGIPVDFDIDLTDTYIVDSSVTVTRKIGDDAEKAVSGTTYGSGKLKFTETPSIEEFGGKTVVYKITAEDKAKNILTRYITVKYLKDELKVSYDVLDYDNTFLKEDITDVNDSNDSLFTVRFTIESNSPLDETSINVSQTGDLTNLYDPTNLKKVTIDPDNYKYVYTYDYKVETAVGESVILNNLKLSVENINKMKADSVVSVIRVDMLKPNTDVTDSSTGLAPLDQWYSNLTLLVKYDDGVGQKFSSGIKSITADGVENVDPSNFDITAPGTQSGQFKVDVKQSPDVNGTKVKFTVTDMVGNETVFEHTYKVDRTAPEPVELKVNNELVDGKYYKGDPTVFYNIGEDVQIKDYELAITLPTGSAVSPSESGSNKPKPGYGNDGALSTFVGSANVENGYPIDGKYELNLTSTNMPGVAGTPVNTTFYVDNSKPVISNINAVQPATVERFRKDGENWKGASSNHPVTITFDTIDKIVNSSSVGIKNIKVTEKIGDGEAKTIVNAEYTDEKGNIPTSIDIPSGNKYSGKTVTYTITATDMLGNFEVAAFTVSYVEGVVKVSHTHPNTTETKDNTVKLTYTIESDAPVKKAGISVVSTKLPDDGKVTETLGDLKPVAEKTDVAADKYTYTIEYTVTAEDSDKITDITCTATNVNGDKSDEDKIDFIYIDLQKPNIIIKGGADETTWFKELVLTITCDDNEREFVSGIKSVTFTGVKQDALGTGFKIEKAKGSSDSKKFETSVDVNESADLTGTPVQMIIEDYVGNTKTYDYTFYVDEHDPTSALSVDGKTAAEVNGTTFGDTDTNPEIVYKTSDNIEVMEYTLDITLPSGTTIQPVKVNNKVEPVDVTTSLKDLIGTENCDGEVPKDGTYTLTFSVKDRAGRVPEINPIVTTFTLDNSIPINDLQITNPVPAKFDEYKNTYSKTPSTIADYEYGQYYAEAVEIEATVKDNNVEEVVILDNGNKVNLDFGLNGGTKTFKVEGDGYHKVTINTTDKSGLKATEAVVEFTIDTTAPQSKITVSGKDSAGFGEDYYIGHTEDDKDPEIGLSVIENLKQYEYHVDVTDPKGGIHKDVYYQKEQEGNFTKTLKLSELCNEEKVGFPLSDELPQDGKYVISLKSEDMAENTAKPVNPVVATFYLDNTAPVLDTATVTLDQTGNNAVIRRTETEDTVTYRGVTAIAASESGGKFTITYETNDPKVNETASGLAAADGIVITEKLGSETRNVEFTKDTESDTVTFDVTANNNYVGKVAEYIITSTDAVGNSTTRTIRVSFAKDEITVKHRSYESGKANTTNGKFDLVYDIHSDVPISVDEDINDVLDAENISLTMGTVDGDKDKNTAGVGVLKKADSYDPDSFNYNYVYTYSIEKTLSDKLQNITVTATNNNGVTSDKDVISLINIDLTNPYIAASNPNESQWFQGLQVTFGYNDGNREYMAGIKSIKITGVKQGLGNYFQSEFDTGVADSQNRVLRGSVTVDINESADLNGTKVTTDIVDNLGRSMGTRSYTFHVDEHNPTSALSVNGKSAADVDGTYIGTNTLNPTVVYTADDNIQVRNYALKITLPSGETITAASGNNVKSVNVPTTLGDLIGAANMNGSVPKDGQYTLTYEVYDMSGRVPDGDAITTTFMLDNTTPKNDLQITTGRPPKFDKFNSTYRNDYTGRSYQYGQYYNTNVSIDAIVTDNNVENITVTDNGSVIYSGTTLNTTHVFSSEGTHNVSISTVDKSGLRAATESVSFTIDKTVPVLSPTLSNAAFAEGGAMRYLSSPASVGISYVETNKDTDDLLMTVTKNAPAGGGSSVTTSRVSETAQTFSDDADYTVKFVATDRAGNKSAERTLTFRVDKTKPELSFTGTVDHGTSTKSVTMNYIVREAFYNDMNRCTLRVYKKVDGANEVLLKTTDIKPNSSNFSMQEVFQEDGEYRFEMAAEDKCGNQATASFTFILDGKAPIITLAGVKNYDKTSDDVTLGITVDETFFTSNKVSLKGTRVDIDGVKNDVTFADFVTNSSKVSKFEQMFKEDGIYDITVTSTDKAGNSTTQKIHFTKDTTDPEIKNIEKYDGTKTNSFTWSNNAEDMVRDLTVCNIKVYMDGVEYNGLSDLADGSHVLRVVATDELGHTTDKEVSFILDTIAPNILISGVEEGQYLKEATQISVSVQIDEDTLTRVTLDGREIDIVDGVATFTVNQRGSYHLLVEAIDEAGNVSTKQLSFNFGEKFPLWIFIVGGSGLLLMLLLLLLVRRRRNKKAA